MPSNSQAGTTSPPSQTSESMTSEEQHGTPNDASGVAEDMSQYDNLVLKERMVELLTHFPGFKVIPGKRNGRDIGLRVCKDLGNSKEEILFWPLSTTLDHCQDVACDAMDMILPKNKGKYNFDDAMKKGNLQLMVRLLAADKFRDNLSQFTWTYEGWSQHRFTVVLRDGPTIDTGVHTLGLTCDKGMKMINELSEQIERLE